MNSVRRTSTLRLEYKRKATHLNLPTPLPFYTLPLKDPSANPHLPARVRRALGATRPRPYTNAPPTSRIWPPRNLPDGLYRDVVSSRCRAQYLFYFVSTAYNICIIVQLMLGATLTAIAGVGSTATGDKHGITITVLAAANTVNAGVVALLHNSGLRMLCSLKLHFLPFPIHPKF
jgi:hypothetical protein